MCPLLLACLSKRSLVFLMAQYIIIISPGLTWGLKGLMSFKTHFKETFVGETSVRQNRFERKPRRSRSFEHRPSRRSNPSNLSSLLGVETVTGASHTFSYLPATSQLLVPQGAHPAAALRLDNGCRHRGGGGKENHGVPAGWHNGQEGEGRRSLIKRRLWP